MKKPAFVVTLLALALAAGCGGPSSTPATQAGGDVVLAQPLT